MKSAGFLLESLFFTEFQVNANAEYSPDSSEERTDPQVKVFFHRRGERSFQMGLGYKVIAEGAADPYTISCLLIGSFIVEDDVPKAEGAKKIAFSGPNILYGALRNQIATMTSASVCGQYILPPIVFGSEDFFQPSDEGLEPADLE